MFADVQEKKRKRVKCQTYQNVDGKGHDDDSDQQIGESQADDKVVSDGLQGPFTVNT